VTAVLAASLVSAQTCYSGVNIFTARGTGEVPPTGLGIEGTHINAVLDAVPNSVATVIDYPATFGNNSVPAGVMDSNEKIAAYLDACPDSKIIVMGYSQGAIVQGLVLTGTTFSINAEGEAQDYVVPALPQKYVDQIAAIVFFGDPGYNANIGTNLDNPYPCTTGSRTPRSESEFGKFGDRLAEWANSDDVSSSSFNCGMMPLSNSLCSTDLRMLHRNLLRCPHLLLLDRQCHPDRRVRHRQAWSLRRQLRQLQQLCSCKLHHSLRCRLLPSCDHHSPEHRPQRRPCLCDSQPSQPSQRLGKPCFRQPCLCICQRPREQCLQPARSSTNFSPYPDRYSFQG
jgi:hypothetical protein